ncbi:hypothetical protein PPYR_14259 [Photinus pyralis]|uniref:SAM domain-containing protein n=1 Tax=Photinus pyralis TaxID=7054 RepID=A0A5N4A4Q3_PHOPY|nr:uncharacterized protein LOC116180899 [Photinus pyralis]KAB0792300.1 hypothetical protein PPYR_14259 [Photinus pyralis]
MDLLETVLRSADAESYLDLLMNNNIDISTLPLLSEEELKIIGIDDEAARTRILEKTTRLTIAHEKVTIPTLTKDDIEIMLNQITNQLYLHSLSLLCALKRPDVVVCDVQLNKPTKCLLNCLSSFEGKLKTFESKMAPKRGTNRTVLVLSATAVFLLIGKVLHNHFK